MSFAKKIFKKIQILNLHVFVLYSPQKKFTCFYFLKYHMQMCNV